MGRSYKKNPVVKDGGKSHKKEKRIACRRLRAKGKKEIYKGERIVADGGGYKKHHEQWDIADDIQRWSKEDAVRTYEEMTGPNASCTCWFTEDFKKDYPTLEKFLEYWAKCMRRK